MRTTLRLFVFFLILITLVFFTYAYHKTLTSFVIEEKAIVTNIIDGDTVEVNLQGALFKVRLLDINTPEKKQPYYTESLIFIKGKIQGKEVLLYRGDENKDRYGRLLRYVFLNDEFINELLLKEGYANFYSYHKTQYTSRLQKAEDSARRGEKGIWEKSRHECASCLSLAAIENGEGKDDCGAGTEYAEFENQCAMKCDLKRWTLKDEARHIYTFTITLQPRQHMIIYNGRGEDHQEEGQLVIFFQNKDKCASVWNDDGDSLFLRDEVGKLVIYEHYE